MQREEAELISFLAGIRLDALPPEVVEDASLRLLDQVGVILAGTREEAAGHAIAYALARGGVPQAHVFGSDERTDAEGAAFANGVSGHVLELDDGNRFAMGHPGVVVIPTVLALGEAVGASGADTIAAIVAGYELFVRLGTAVNPSHYNRGFHTTGTVGTLAATAAAARLLGFDEATLASALGLAGSQAGGLFEFLEDGTMSKQLHAGVAAAAAIRSVRLAGAGFTGPATVLQGKNGFLRAMADEVDAGALNRGLGERWAVQECYVKLHACCRHIHPVVDALNELVAEHGITPAAIRAIDVGTYRFAAKLDRRDVTTELDAKLSIPFSAAVTLLEGQCGLGQFRSELFADARVERLMGLVHVSLDPELDALVPKMRGCRVAITTPAGTVRTEALLPRGEPETPVGIAEIKQKYADLVGPHLTPAVAAAYAEAVLTVAQAPDVSQLNRLLGPGSRRYARRAPEAAR